MSWTGISGFSSRTDASARPAVDGSNSGTGPETEMEVYQYSIQYSINIFHPSSGPFTDGSRRLLGAAATGPVRSNRVLSAEARAVPGSRGEWTESRAVSRLAHAWSMRVTTSYRSFGPGKDVFPVENRSVGRV